MQYQLDIPEHSINQWTRRAHRPLPTTMSVDSNVGVVSIRRITTLFFEKMDENVERFISLTGTSVDIAKNLLEACAGNLDMAINMHLDNDSSAHRKTDGLIDRRGLEDTSERSVTKEESTETDRRSYEEM